MSRNIDTWNDINTFSCSIGNNICHLALCQVFSTSIRILGAITVAVTKSRRKIIYIACGCSNIHIIQRKPKSLIIRQIKFYLIESGCCCVINDFFDIFGTEILSTRIQMNNFIEIIITSASRCSGCCNSCSFFVIFKT